MDFSSKLHFAGWTLMNLLCAFSHEVTVRDSDLRVCERDQRVCVTDLRDCGRPLPSSVQKTLNMSCYYQMSQRYMACELSEEFNGHTESEVSLFFSSRDKIVSCQGIFNPAAVLNVTARIKNYMLGSVIWSRPHTVFLYGAVKLSPPVLTVLGSTADSVDVSWRSGGGGGSCRLRYRVNHTHVWTQAPDSVRARRDRTLSYTIRGLQPFTVYRAAVSCREESGVWSDWSSDVTARTRARAPSRPPEVCYRWEKREPDGRFLLHLTWKALDPTDSGGNILGYQVSYEPAGKRLQQHGLIRNVTEVTALLVVEEGNWRVTVTAFNVAGYGPAAHLSGDARRPNTLPSVRHLWVSSLFPDKLMVQWDAPTATPSGPSVSHIAVRWCPEARPSTSHGITEDSFANSTIIHDINPDESYQITVFPVYNQQCGSPQSLTASPQQGALLEAVKLKVASVNKTALTVEWAWQKKSAAITVKGYRVMLRKDSETQTLPLWPDQLQHTFLNLKPNTEYSLHLLADNVSRSIIPVRTDFDELTTVATVAPLLLLAVTLFVISILSRTVYKSYFFPPISSPWGSTAGQWLMDPNHQKTAERNILNIEDFQVKDVLGGKGLIVVSPKSHHSSEEDVHRDTSLLSLSHVIIKLSDLRLDTELVSDAPVAAEHQHSCFPQKNEENQLLDLSELSHQREAAVKSCFREYMANTNGHYVYQMIGEAEYMLNASLFGKTDVETVCAQTDCPDIICQTDYIPNSCFIAKTAEPNLFPR